MGGLNAADERVAPSPSILPIMLKRNGSDGMLEIVSTLPHARRPAYVGETGEHVHAVRFIEDGRVGPAIRAPLRPARPA